MSDFDPKRTLMTLKYDDASWHYGGDFPGDLPIEAAATHTGMFVAWALLSGLSGQLHAVDLPEDLVALRGRSISPGTFFLTRCDGKFVDDNLSERGNAFAAEYFSFEHGRYLADYEGVFGEHLPSLYHVPDTWESFDRLKPLLDDRFSAWFAANG